MMAAKSYSGICFFLCAVFLALLLSNSVEAAGRGDSCGKIPAPGFDRPPNQPRSGHYSNAQYGFEVDIPPSLTGYVSAQPPERGFGIVLSWSPRAFLRVEAAYDAFFDITSQGVHRSDLTTIRLRDTVVDDRATAIKLAQKDGGRYVTHVRCVNDPQIFMHDQVIVMLNREIYRLDLQTVPERYEEDVKVLNEMLQSWRWVRPVSQTP